MSRAGTQDRANVVGATPDQRAQPRADATSPRVVHSAVLLDGCSQLAILHNETVYFLRQTRFGKLILTK